MSSVCKHFSCKRHSLHFKMLRHFFLILFLTGASLLSTDKCCLIRTPMTGWVVLYFHITSYLTESSVNAIHEDTLRRISPIRFVHSSKYDRYYTHLVFYDFMCVCLFRFHVKHINCILCSRRHVIKFLQSLRESAGRGIQCKQARVLEWTQWITLQKKERYVTNASSQGRRLSS